MTCLPQPGRDEAGEPRPACLQNGSLFERDIVSQEVGGTEVQADSSGRYKLANIWGSRGTV